MSFQKCQTLRYSSNRFVLFKMKPFVNCSFSHLCRYPAGFVYLFSFSKTWFGLGLVRHHFSRHSSSSVGFRALTVMSNSVKYHSIVTYHSYFNTMHLECRISVTAFSLFISSIHLINMITVFKNFELTYSVDCNNVYCKCRTEQNKSINKIGLAAQNKTMNKIRTKPQKIMLKHA